MGYNLNKYVLPSAADQRGENMAALKHVMINDIIEDQNVRMQNLRKYYPFFCLCDTAFTQFKDGRYAHLDMGYITMASLRFFINENNFNEQEVTYEQYEAFLLELLRRDYALNETPEEERQLVSYIFDKLKNDGRAFEFHFFDPETKATKTARVKYIDSHIVEGTVKYHITAEGIEFYLDTKEMKEESKISVQQLLLGKLIAAKNFKGGIEVVKRINSEVSKLIYEKQEVLHILSYDVFAGAKACEEYMATAARWFTEEQKLFTKNKQLIEQALKTATGDTDEPGRDEFYKSLEDIHILETELKKTIKKHNDLISETIALQTASDKIISRAKFRRLRNVFDFRETLVKTQKQDNPAVLGALLAPLFTPRLKKTFSVKDIDNLLSYRQDMAEQGEKITKASADTDFVYEDELEDIRIAANFRRIFSVLLDQLSKKQSVDLNALNGILEIKFGRELFINGDYYSFLSHLSQKREYDMARMLEKQDTFLEGIVSQDMTEDEKQRYHDMYFTVTYLPEEKINLSSYATAFARTRGQLPARDALVPPEERFIVTNMRFDRKERQDG